MLFVYTGCQQAETTDIEQKLNTNFEQVENINEIISEVEETQALASQEGETIVPENYNLDIPFQPQAPYADWGMPYQEGCEEASIILSVKYLQGVTSITPAEMDAEILALVDWQNSNWGGHHDLTVEQTARLLEEYYDREFETEIIYNFSWKDVQQAISQGYPVIAPTAGRELGNPYYTAPGPLYHMLVIKGYSPTQVITNDVGTRRGADYKYSYETLYNGIHDWNNGDVSNGKKAVIVVK